MPCGFSFVVFYQIMPQAVCGIHCRSPPLHLDFSISKIQMEDTYGEVMHNKSIYQRE